MTPTILHPHHAHRARLRPRLHRGNLAAAAVLAALLLPSSAHAESPTISLDPDWLLTIDGQLRPRVLVHTGKDFVQEGTAREFVTQRARLGFTLAQESGATFTMRIQDVRVWGEETDTLNDSSANGLDVHEAFGVVPLGDGLSLKLGRQEIVLDDHRLVGNVDWTQRARSFDGGRLTLSSAPLTVNVFYAKVREAEPDLDGHVRDEPGNDVEDDLDFGGAHLEVAFAEGHKLSSLYLINADHGFEPSGQEHLRHTAGLFVKGSVGGWSYQGEGYYQFGRLRDAQIAAFLAAARVGYQAELPAKPKVTVWGELVSGDGTPQGTFDTLYATNHKFYGEMDFFLAIPSHTGNLGLLDAGGQLAASATSDIDLNIDVHHFRSVESSATGSSTFGNEVDFKVQYRAMKSLSLRALYGVFVPGDAMRAVRRYAQEVDMKPEHLAYGTMDLKF